MKYWCRWYADDWSDGSSGIEAWCTGSTMDEPERLIFCGIVFGDDENECLVAVQKSWLGVTNLDFAEPKSSDWRPPPDRFPPI
jgi:hypothetical protein